MKIGELSARSGVAASAIRFYEQCGLLPPPTRGANGYRIYSEAAVSRLRIVSLALSFGLSIENLRTAFDAVGNLEKPRLLDALDARLAAMDELIGALQMQRTQLHDVLTTLNTNWSNGRCVDPMTLGKSE